MLGFCGTSCWDFVVRNVGIQCLCVAVYINEIGYVGSAAFMLHALNVSWLVLYYFLFMESTV